VSDKVSEKLELEQLSGGYRIVLAMAADLAIRMVLANPHLKDQLQSEAIVLIDEIELHLHPEWQQRIIGDLRRTFPNAQFIVSTHSPQVLTTVTPEHIVHLRATDDGIVAEQETEPTFGAKAGNVLSAVMGVDERPDNEFTKRLKRYQAMIADGAGETPEAKELRAELEQLSLDPQLAALDIEITRRRVMRELAAKR
jgi:predicted ATP-binding protein involved in virulence